MTVEIIAIERNINMYKMTRVLFRRDGRDYKFLVGAHVSEGRINDLAETLGDKFITEITERNEDN